MKYFAHKLYLLIAHVLHRSIILSLSSRSGPAFQTWHSQSSFSVNLPWTACGFVCNVSISLSFPAPTSSTDLNSNNKKLYSDFYDRIASNNANSLLHVRNAFWVSGGRGAETRYKKIFMQGYMQGKLVWNHLWEHRFSAPDPRVFPPPGDRFSAQTTVNRIYNWAALKRGSPVINLFTKWWTRLLFIALRQVIYRFSQG